MKERMLDKDLTGEAGWKEGADEVRARLWFVGNVSQLYESLLDKKQRI